MGHFEAIDLPDTPNYDTYREPILDTLIGLTPGEAALYFATYGNYAPSAHNKQGRVVNFSEESHIFTVWPRQEDIGSPSDTKGRQTYIGVGCFAENVRQTLAAYGLSERYDLLDHGVRFYLSNVAQGKLMTPTALEIMRRRRVNRGKFDQTYVLPPEIAQNIRSIANDLDLHFSHIQDRPTILVLAELQATADRIVILAPKFRKELAEHLEPNDTRKTRVMPGATFGLSDESAQKVHLALQSEGQFDGDFAAGFANADRDGIASASAVGILSVDSDVPAQWINAGIAFQRIWLMAERQNLGIGVMAGMVESTLHNITLKARLGLTRARPTVVFRIGKPMEIMPHSPRVPTEELFEQPNSLQDLL